MTAVDLAEMSGRRIVMTCGIVTTRQQPETPDILINVLNGMDKAGILEHTVVVGSAALHGYENAAGGALRKAAPCGGQRPAWDGTDMHLLASLPAFGSADEMAVQEAPTKLSCRSRCRLGSGYRTMACMWPKSPHGNFCPQVQCAMLNVHSNWKTQMLR